MDTWLLWNLTGGPDGGVHVTDVTNASRTLLMDLRTLAWDEEIGAEMRVPTSLLPEISSSSEVYGRCRPGILRTCRWPASSATSRRRPSGRPASSRAPPRTRTARATSMLLNTGEEIVPRSTAC